MYYAFGVPDIPFTYGTEFLKGIHQKKITDLIL